MASRARADFNAIRLLFTHEYVLKNDIVEAPADTQPGDLLFQIRYVDMFASLARAAARRGIIILLACHRVKHDAWPGAGLWHDAALGYPIDKVLESWGSMASKLCGVWNIFAADLQNEPHAASWAKGLATDWNKGAEQLGNHVLSICPRWMIFVEGVGYDPGAPGADRPDVRVHTPTDPIPHATRARLCVCAVSIDMPSRISACVTLYSMAREATQGPDSSLTDGSYERSYVCVSYERSYVCALL